MEVTKDLPDTLYARWIPNTYAVTLDESFPTFTAGDTYAGYAPYGVSKDAGTGSVTATFDAAMPTATMPQAAGYAFQGYFGRANGAGTKYYNADGSSAHAWDKAADATLYGHWELVSYDVTLNVGAGEVPDAADRGWERDEGDASLYRKGYSIESARFQLPANATKPGYATFDGWTGDGIEKPTKVVVVQPYDLRAKAFTGSFSSPIEYTAALDLAGGSFASAPEGWSEADGAWVRPFTVESEAFSLPTPTRAGHDFSGWALVGTDGSLGSPAPDVAVSKGTVGDLSYRAVWAARSYTVTWDYSGQVIDGQRSATSTQAYGAPIAFPTRPSAADPAREHYAFAGWYTAATEGELVKAGDYLVEGASTYYARWKPVEYVAHLHMDGGHVEKGGEKLPMAEDGHFDLPFTVEAAVSLPSISAGAQGAKPVREGMEFKGWVACAEDGSAEAGAVPQLEVTLPAGSHGDRHYLATWAVSMRFEVPSSVAFRYDLADEDDPVSKVEGEGVAFRSLSQGRLYVADLAADVAGAEPDSIVTAREKVLLRCMSASAADAGYGWLPLPRTAAPERVAPEDLVELGFGKENALAPMGTAPLRYEIVVQDPLTTLAGEVDGLPLAKMVFTVALAS